MTRSNYLTHLIFSAPLFILNFKKVKGEANPFAKFLQ